MNDREFRQYLAGLLAKQRNPDQPSWKNVPTPEPAPELATKSNKEFRRHIAQVLAQQRNEDQQPVEKKPPKSEPSRPAAVTEKKQPVAELGKFKVRKKAK